MARDISGTGRVSIFPFLHDWETSSRCVLAYTTTDNASTAVLGVIPVEGNVHEPGDLFAMAGRHGFIGEWKGTHEQRCGCWLVCTGMGSRTVKKPGTLDLIGVAWSLDMSRTVALDAPYAGHARVTAGRITFEDPALMTEARGLIRVPAGV